ncbi:protein-tyrosine phosphatase family protein [Thermogladius sp. 4427co]|uniref:protein-tyrosine phosphatase family protein n=1 Tax=Thermogladius sp. 4427co TaxID=3450718 RepID=UPI003F79CC8C
MLFHIAWIIPSQLAQSQRPPLSLIQELSKTFGGVVNLLTEEENPSPLIQEFEEYGVEVYHIPTPDFHPVEILDLVGAVAFIDRLLGNDKKVLVHCQGGIGRSSQVTASYLLFRGHSLFQAVNTVRTQVPNALDTYWELRAVEEFSILYEIYGRSKLLEIYERIVRNMERRAVKYLSKLLRFALEISEVFGIRRSEIRDIVENIIYREQPVASELGKHILNLVEKLNFDDAGRFVALKGDSFGGIYYITILCDLPCDRIVELLAMESPVIERLTGRRIIVEQASYLDYV